MLSVYICRLVQVSLVTESFMLNPHLSQALFWVSGCSGRLSCQCCITVRPAKRSSGCFGGPQLVPKGSGLDLAPYGKRRTVESERVDESWMISLTLSF